VFAHSQGNLILSNALSAIAAVDGKESVKGYEIHSFGSPAAHWPPGLMRREYAFTFDLIAMASGFDWRFNVSKVGAPTGYLNPFTHQFAIYRDHDPAFVVNSFRWGGLGVTLSLDEEGLAAYLAEMGANVRRVPAIFDHLRAMHPMDVDDVAVCYVKKMRKRPGGTDQLKRMGAESGLLPLLIKAMSEGWVSGGEKDAIEFLKKL